MSKEVPWDELDESELRAIIHQQYQEIRLGATMELPIQFIDQRLDVINTVRAKLSERLLYSDNCLNCKASLRRCDKIFSCCRDCDHPSFNEMRNAA